MVKSPSLLLFLLPCFSYLQQFGIFLLLVFGVSCFGLSFLGASVAAENHFWLVDVCVL